MRVGAVFPQNELGNDPDAVRRIGQAVEELGYDHLLAYDHVLGAVHEGRNPPLTGPYTEHDPFVDPFVLFSYLAGRTERLEFVTGILIAPQRPTVLIAKQAADLAVLSDNRFRLGVGIGWNYVEYEALGQDFHTRGARLEEQVGLIRRLWTEPVVQFDGKSERIDRAGILPRPSRPIPIWFGAASERAFRRAARLGDGLIFATPLQQSRKAWDRVQSMLEQEGRDPAAFGGEIGFPASEAPHAIVDAVEQWTALGGTHISVRTLGAGFTSVDQHIDYFAAVAHALGRA
ncbi:MAG: class F420-dependent oxidoreductase [Actinomycetia bacterium]|nr:class F420-dependent oxidoreductase [Actinomycetes bacterium]